jgi:pyruvate formate lyase activating enzyme
MQIGGFVKQSLIDYPGKIAAVVFTQGCNFRCGYCHNPQLVLPELFYKNQSTSVGEILLYLEERKNWLDGVVVTGGEPTIHNDLPVFLKKIKKLGYQVKLDSNGSNPSMLELVIKEKLADCIAMDIKILPDNDAYAEIIGISNVTEIMKKVLSSIQILKGASIDVEFRTTALSGYHDQGMIDLIKKYIGNDRRYTINEFREGDLISAYL